MPLANSLVATAQLRPRHEMNTGLIVQEARQYAGGSGLSYTDRMTSQIVRAALSTHFTFEGSWAYPKRVVAPVGAANSPSQCADCLRALLLQVIALEPRVAIPHGFVGNIWDTMPKTTANAVFPTSFFQEELKYNPGTCKWSAETVPRRPAPQPEPQPEPQPDVARQELAQLALDTAVELSRDMPLTVVLATVLSDARRVELQFRYTGDTRADVKQLGKDVKARLKLKTAYFIEEAAAWARPLLDELHAQTEGGKGVRHEWVMLKWRIELGNHGRAVSTPLPAEFLSRQQLRFDHTSGMWFKGDAVPEEEEDDDDEDDNDRALGPAEVITLDELCPARPDAALPPMQADSRAELQRLLDLLPEPIRACVDVPLDDLLEVVLDVGDPVTLLVVGADGAEREERRPLSTSPTDMLRSSDVLAVADQLEFGRDGRAVIDGALHRIACMRDHGGRIYALTMRVGRAVTGSLSLLLDMVFEKDLGSLLLLGAPGVGKTTVLREMSRVLAEQRRVVIVDTSNEIAGGGYTKHAAVGRARRMMVPLGEQQHNTMVRAVENHNPRVVVIDEIGTKAEALAAATIAQRGVQLVGTAHGVSLADLVANPYLSRLAGGSSSVILSAKEAEQQGQSEKLVRRRAAPPVFDTVVELRSREEWVIVRNVGDVVDAMLSGRPAEAERRVRLPDGRVLRQRVGLDRSE